MKKLIIACALLCSSIWAMANTPLVFEENINWLAEAVTLQVGETEQLRFWSFEGADYVPQHPTLPVYNKDFRLPTYGSLLVQLTEMQFEPLERTLNADDAFLKETIEFQTAVNLSRRQAYGSVRFVPIRKNPMTGAYEKLVAFKMTVTVRPEPLPISPAVSRNLDSELAEGDIYKLAVRETGVYKLTYSFLKNELGITNLDNIDPRTIKLLGDGGGVLPQSNATFRYNDVPENAIYIEGENDGKFDPSDFILFYGESPDNWFFSESNETYLMNKNPYTVENNYFIKISAGNGKRIAEQPSVSSTAYTTTTYDFYTQYEDDRLNLQQEDQYRYGSGQVWFGESFKFSRTQSFNFDVPNIVNNDSVRLTVSLAAADVAGTSRFAVQLNNTTLGNLDFSAISADVTKIVARRTTRTFKTPNSAANLAVQLAFSASPNADGWLDYINVNARRNLVFYNGQMTFRDRKTLNYASSTFSLSNANNVTVWDVTSPIDVSRQAGNLTNGVFSFGVASETLNNFIAFDGSNFLAATPLGKIENQNLHALATPEMLIIYHPDFKNAAERLAAHRREFSNLSVATADIFQIYNEFSSGSLDVSGIRDFVKYLYEKGDLKYLLLFGDASFDFRGISLSANDKSQLFVPTFETRESLDPIAAFPTDDYFGLLDATEGSSPESVGLLDIGIGRFPVTTEADAERVIDKIIAYETDANYSGDWKTNLTFIADDEDSNTHIRDADGIARRVASANPFFNIDKIYTDAYRQDVISAGERYPDVEDAIRAKAFKGNLVMCYLGHGDSKGLTQERIFDEAKAAEWSNRDRLPLFVTATCSFGPYDNHDAVSIGEQLFLRPDGGAIALLTTTRLVFASSNRALTQSVFDEISKGSASLGDLLMISKNSCAGCTSNSRKFSLFGDPAMILRQPEYKIVTTSINNKSATLKDTLQAMEEITVTGVIQDLNGNVLNNYNGTIYPTVFDKFKQRTGLGNDPTSRPAFGFEVQNNILFKGRASVTNGAFSFKFVVPKDIDYEYGFGKLSYYANNDNNAEAWGYHDTVYIGGTYLNGIGDDLPPTVNVFMNDENFVFGGITDENPVIYVKLSDDSGINTSNVGIGHGITAVLDENTQESYLLSDFYEAKLDDYRSGTARYPLSKIAEGRHELRITAWDVANNSGTGYTEFVVASGADAALKHVLNYPNPFTTRTEFQFEHNLPAQPLQVQVQIFTVSGKLVKTIQEEVFSEGYRVTGITWDGLDDFGSPIGRGVYVYKVTIGLLSDTNQVQTSASEFQKLVILR